MTKSTYLVITLAMLFGASACTAQDIATSIKPLHLDDIHLIVTDEDATVAFFHEHFGAREMAHPGERFKLVRFMSVKWQDPTITITRTGPYEDLPAERNQRWLDAEIISPGREKDKPVYGARWLALATASLDDAHRMLVSAGVVISEPSVELPMEPSTAAFSVLGPDGLEIVIVERPERDFGEAMYSLDHIQFLVSDVDATQRFFERGFAGNAMKRVGDSVRLQVADAALIVSESGALGLNAKDVAPRRVEGVLRIGLDHLGFLQRDIYGAVAQAKQNGVSPIFEPQRYLYKGKPTVYTFTAFASPDDFTVEMVQADGRIGPHSYYVDQNEPE